MNVLVNTPESTIACLISAPFHVLPALSTSLSDSSPVMALIASPCAFGLMAATPISMAFCTTLEMAFRMWKAGNMTVTDPFQNLNALSYP